MSDVAVEQLVKARLRLANVPERMLGWSFGTFPGPGNRMADRWAGVGNAVADVQAFATDGTASPGLILMGRTGCGKTSLAVSALRAAVEAETTGASVSGDVLQHAPADWDWSFAEINHRRQREGTEGPRRLPPAWFDTWAGLRVALRAARDGEPDLLRELCGVRILVLDDLAVGELTPWREETLLALLGRVERGRRTLVTSNLPPAAMLPFVGERVVDRLSDPDVFRVVEVAGESLRGAKGGGA